MSKKLGLLCTIDGPLLRFFIESLQAGGYERLFLLADYKGFGEGNLSRFQARTKNHFMASELTTGELSELKIPVIFVNSHNDRDCISLVASLELDLLINVGTPRKLSENFLQNVGCEVLNVHPGVLPHYRGSSCVEWAILEDAPIGNSAHFMATEYDAGPIIKVESYHFERDSSYSDIRTKLYLNAISLMTESIGLVFEDGLTSQNLKPQDLDIDPYPPISQSDMMIVLEKIESNNHPAICIPKT